jgi:hypothetical protein
MKQVILSLIIIALSIGCNTTTKRESENGPDTIKVEPSIYYTSDKEPFQGKDFASRVRYAREDIIFSETHKRIEYCYYYDNKRECGGTDYQITNDSTLKIDNSPLGIDSTSDVDKEIWNYKKRGEKYFIERYFNGTYVSGFAKSLIPLEIIGLSTTMTADKIDTLWAIDYSKCKPSQSYDSIWIFHTTKVKGKIFAQDKVDEIPTLLNGDPLKIVYLHRTNICVSEPPPMRVEELKFVISKEGRFVNIKQSIGDIDKYGCPDYALDLIRSVLQLGKIKPAKVKGQNVNVEWTLKVIYEL